MESATEHVDRLESEIACARQVILQVLDLLSKINNAPTSES
jgi:hypothetical protein